MPKQKDFKRLVRARMKKSGESYTAARRQLLAKDLEDGSRPARFALAGMSDAAVRAKTGRDWKQWVATLDAAGAARLAHRDIASLLHSGHGLPGWWAQTVAVGYERIRGLRDVGQRRGGAHAGTYDASKNRTFPVAATVLYRAFRHGPTRARWWVEADFKVRRATPSRSLRIVLADGSAAEMWFVAKGRAKSSVQIQQHGCPTKAAADLVKRAWASRLDALAALLRE